MNLMKVIVVISGYRYASDTILFLLSQNIRDSNKKLLATKNVRLVHILLKL